ncbi:tRNA lysidine(34) synthetase TilS [Bartonella massiliensis]|uniref:tRNA lysidine(34) synthetase TilS n=1 Tax=Bartonella massiliensis TaxID=929795 RepID=UPI001157CEF1|nr:tRNA lysidine(34) synthetase TilS [Bartonella massiliensis]
MFSVHELAGNLFKTSDFIQCQRVILAVSGGSDSLALMFLVKEHFETLSVSPEIIAVTVDHQLRKESAREAEIVAEICRTHHIKHITVRWEGEKPKTHIAASARVARYDLLVLEAQKQGASLIMTGHTLNDQVETYQMRYQRLQKNKGILYDKAGALRDGASAGGFVGALRGEAGALGDGVPAGGFVGALRGEAGALGDGVPAGGFAGALHDKAGALGDEDHARKTRSHIAEKSYDALYARGLSCIPREALLHRKVRLIRPLLGVKRQTLRNYLRLRGKTWIDDPTNEDRNFERVRVRQSLSSQKLADIAQKINEAALQRRQQAKNIADLILALDITVQHGRCFIAKPASFLQKHSCFPFVVGLFAVLMGGACYLLPKQKLSTLVQKICLYSSKKKRFTYAGCVIEYNKSGIALWREGRNMKEAIVEPDATFIWDGRYHITNHGSEAIKVGAAHLEQLKSLLKNSNFDLKKPHFPSLQSLLMISNDKGCDIPELISQAVVHKNVMIKRIMAPFDWLSSREDDALVNVVEPFFNLEVKR